MDRTTDLTDAFVEVRFADYETFRTQICRRTLNPVWNEDFRFEVTDDSDLQNEPLELKIMDYDQITYNDAIGTVFIDLNPLLTWDSPAQIAGWLPIYDTLLGVRGELCVQVKLQLFGDINPFKDSSAGVQFFSVSRLPPGYAVVAVLGFVAALDHEDDPEYHWSDNFRTPRKSNEARSRVLFRLAGHIRRQLGRKVLDLNGNAVLSFRHYYDLESEVKSITARAIGTAVRIAPVTTTLIPPTFPNSTASAMANPIQSATSCTSLQSPTASEHSPGRNSVHADAAPSSPSPAGHVEGNVLTSGDASKMAASSATNAADQPVAADQSAQTSAAIESGSAAEKQVAAASENDQIASSGTPDKRNIASDQHLDNLNDDAAENDDQDGEEDDDEDVDVDCDDDDANVQEIELPPPLITQPSHVGASTWRSSDQVPLTLDEFPTGAILGIGGLVSATSVKVLDKDDRDPRASWWTELRDEIKSHARSLRCPFVIGYTEQASISEEVAVLHCTGTAAWVDLSVFGGSVSVNVPMTATTATLASARAAGIPPNSDINDAGEDANLNADAGATLSSPRATRTAGQGLFYAATVPTGSVSQHASGAAAIPIGSSYGENAVSGAPNSTTSIADVNSGSLDDSINARPSRYGTSPQDGTNFRQRAVLRRGSQVSYNRAGITGDADEITGATGASRRPRRRNQRHLGCRACHVTYSHNKSPFPMVLTRCALCKRKYVPELLLTTIESPPELETIGKGVFIEAFVCRQKKTRPGDTRAVSISEAIPFAQYDIHRQLMYKLRMYGLNAVFGLRFQISVGENLMTAVATGTAIYVRALPTPPALKVLRNLDVLDEEDEKLMDLQRRIMIQSETNRKRIEEALKIVQAAETNGERGAYAAASATSAVSGGLAGSGAGGMDSDSDSNSSKSDGVGGDDDDLLDASGVGIGPSTPGPSSASAAVGTGRSGQSQRGVVVQIDDEQDEDLVLFLDQTFPEGFELYSTQFPASTQHSMLRRLSNFQMVTMIKQSNIDPSTHHPNRHLASIFRALYQELQYHVAYFSPCIVLGIRHRVHLPKDQGVQVCLQAMVVGGLPPKRIEGVRAPGLTQSNSSLNLYDQGQQSQIYTPPRMSATAMGMPVAATASIPGDPRLTSLQRQATTASLGSNASGVSSVGFSADDIRDDGGVGGTAASDEPSTSMSPQYAQKNSGMPSVVSGSSGRNPDRSTLLRYTTGGTTANLFQSHGAAFAQIAAATANSFASAGSWLNGLGILSTENATNTSTSLPPINMSYYPYAGATSSSVNTSGPMGLDPYPPSHPYNSSNFHNQYSDSINVELSPLSWIPNTRIVRFLGRISLHFINESNNLVTDVGVGSGAGAGSSHHHYHPVGTTGMGGFTHVFLAKLFAVVKAHTTALGGNAILGFSMDHVMFSESIKNQGYALVSVSGDVVELEYLPLTSLTVNSPGAANTAANMGGGRASDAAANSPFTSPVQRMNTSTTTQHQQYASIPSSSFSSSTPAMNPGLAQNAPVPSTSTGSLSNMAAAAAAGMSFGPDDFLAVPQRDFATELFDRI